MRLVVALGGNALLQRTDRPDAAVQRRHVATAANALAPLTEEHDLLLCHGNGPQIGMLALESADDPVLSRPFPLDTLGALTQGMIGYWLAQELPNAGVRRPVTVVLTQTVVDPDDPEFRRPTKFIGRTYDRSDAVQLAQERGWQVAPDGPAWRRVVPSPEPRRILEMTTIRRLSKEGDLVVCAGGGGAPVVCDDTGVHGVEAVVDKDLTAALLAIEIGADRLLLLTDVAAVSRDFGTPGEATIRSATVAELRALSFPSGSMGPKIEACSRFTEATGHPSGIGALAQAVDVLGGRAGTTVVADRVPAGA